MHKYNRKSQSVLLYAVFIFYIILFLSIVIFKYVSLLELFSENRTVYRSFNILPFYTIKSYLMGTVDVSHSVGFNNIFGNIALFIPLGIYLQLFKKNKKVFVNFASIFAISLSIEIIQFIFGLGATDIDDVLLNCAGGIIGILCYKLLAVFIKDHRKIRTAITICSSIVGIPMFVITVLLLINR